MTAPKIIIYLVLNYFEYDQELNNFSLNNDCCSSLDPKIKFNSPKEKVAIF